MSTQSVPRKGKGHRESGGESGGQGDHPPPRGRDRVRSIEEVGSRTWSQDTTTPLLSVEPYLSNYLGPDVPTQEGKSSKH